MELVLVYLAAGIWQFTPWWGKALLLAILSASPFLLGAALLARARRRGQGP